MRRKIFAATVALVLLVLCACTPDTPSQVPLDTTPQTPEQPSFVPDTSPMQEIKTYQNPVLTADSPDAWEGYGFGDPFVMRHGGRYYLYVSTKDGQVGIKCWTSDDLVNWTYAGLCATDTRTRGAYAPEVYYYNGYFYMYTSPAGNGHYVLRSTSPTKGFEVVTDNMGMSIDGSVFIDNDGKWYFYTANHGEMMVYDMTSPTRMKKGRTLSSISVNGAWTEGPMTVYHDGYYYMTYTGNHVLSRAYRINYGVSATSPLKFANISVQNPLLIHTAGKLFGIGHNSMVKGPDLDSYYIVYHSLVNATPNRNTHVDRIAFNGAEMKILGPVDGEQQVPSMPDVYHRFEQGGTLDGWVVQGSAQITASGLALTDGNVISKQEFAGDFTAEYCVLSIDGGLAGAIFAYTDEQNFGACLFDPASQSLHIEITADGRVQSEQIPLVKSFGENVRFDCMQTLQIERKGNTYTFYVNDRLAHTQTTDALAGGAIGLVSRGNATFGFIGGTGAVGGRGAADEYHSIGTESGLIPASHYTLGSYATVQKEGVHAVVAPTGSVLNYRVLAQSGDAYDLAVRYATEDADAEIEIYVDGNMACTLTLAASDGLQVAICRKIPMSRGQHTLSVKVTKGSAQIVEFKMLTHANVPEHMWSFDELADGNVYSDGNWRATGSMSTSRSPVCAKRLYGNGNWGDYAATVKVTPGAGVNCGLVVRATNPGVPNFVHQNCTTEDSEVGTDWLQGYFVGICEGAVVLGKQNYSYTELARASGTYTEGSTYELRVECLGANIRVYVDGALAIDYTDPQPFMQGLIGLRTHKCAAKFAELQIKPLDE